MIVKNDRGSSNNRALQWTNGLTASNAFITLVTGPSQNSESGAESESVSANVWHGNDTGSVSFAGQSNTQQLLASTEKVRRSYGTTDDSTSNTHSEQVTVTAMSFSDHIYSPSNLITTTSESTVKPELALNTYFINDVVVVSGDAKAASVVENRTAKARIIWTDDLREILIQEMKKRPCLWDQNHPKYRDVQYAANERNEVIESFYHRTGYALNAEDIARQWKSLRDQYVRFINKIRNMEPSDSRFPSFKFSEELKFLMPYRQLPQSRYCIILSDENGLQNLNESSVSKESCSEFTFPSTSATNLLPFRRKRRHEKSSDYKTQKDGDSKIHDREDGCCSRMDEFDHFGLSIADYIRGISKLDEKAAVWIRGEIWTLLTKCRMKTLEGCSVNGPT
ncbi:unnamed protein product [Thelazia callipaeda]|uniref:MADF domain-containing protein n=1 Tax=Thelazia callipaeda TaxID=103827 RepID=A0A0N5CM78_THECL|nr:unnamed protein product [Thelazia callipaeda]